ncbi:MAG: tetratricopeptide repeat protein [Alphaproteobacteria bacterium]
MRATTVFLGFVLLAGAAYYMLRVPQPEHPRHAACYGVTVDDAEATALRKAAGLGDAHALHQTGLMELYGRDGAPDPKEGIVLLKVAAAQGDAEAQYALGELYSSRTSGIRNDVYEARKYLLMAAEQGHGEAMSTLAYMLSPLIHDNHAFQTPRTPQDREQAVLWTSRAAVVKEGVRYHAKDAPFDAARIEHLRKQAEAGEARAQFELALLLREGLGAEKDEKQAMAWMEKAAAQDNTPALRLLSGWVWKDDVPRRKKLLDRAAELGDAKAMSWLAFQYMPSTIISVDGKPPERDYPLNPAKAIELYTQAAKLNDAYALLNLGGIFYRNEFGMPKDSVLAYALMTRAARNAATRGSIYMHYDCDAVAASLSPEDMARARKLSLEWPGNYPPPPPPPQ